MGWRRTLAILIGFAGILVILRPGLRAFSLEAILPLAGALLFAFYVLFTRKVSRTDTAETTFFYTGIVGAIAITFVTPLFWTPIVGLGDWSWMGLLCATAALSHFLLIKAYQMSEVSIIQPFAYTQLLFVALLAILIFNEFPDLWTVAGGALIVVAGSYTLISMTPARRHLENHHDSKRQ